MVPGLKIEPNEISNTAAAAAMSWAETNAKRATVAVIGCGPGGMFFLHAVATKRRMMEEAGDTEGMKKLPDVTVFERSSDPGGVWRSNREFGHDEEEKEGVASGTTNMYEALWTNGPKENFEFFDYTYEDHFGGIELPTYMPRQPILEYFTARITRKNPNVFENVHFDTSVVSVKYDEERSKFIVSSKKKDSEDELVGEYDKCIWAAGSNGKPVIPENVDTMLKKGGFRGKTMHSSNVGNFQKDIKDKRVVLIGDAYSSEDLALQAVKLGAEQVYIYSRSSQGIAAYMGAWPLNKVEVIEDMNPTHVIQDGCGIRFEEMVWDMDTQDYTTVKDTQPLDLKNIAAVVYCTGYSQSMDMLDESIRQPWLNDNEYEDLPPGWKMKCNTFTDEVGDVDPSPILTLDDTTVTLGMYRGLVISNPNMMYYCENSETPLFEVDVTAWLFLAYIVGDIEIPTPEIMHQRNEAEILELMDMGEYRYTMDENYAKAGDALYYKDENHWGFDMKDPRTLAYNRECEVHCLKLLARNMKDSGYPLDIGTYEKFNEKGKQLVQNNAQAMIGRVNLEENGGRESFRDCQQSYRSILTGITAAPLRKIWLDLEESDYDDLLGRGKSMVK